MTNYTMNILLGTKAELKQFLDEVGHYTFTGPDGYPTQVEDGKSFKDGQGWMLRLTGKADLFFTMGRIDAYYQGEYDFEPEVQVSMNGL